MDEAEFFEIADEFRSSDLWKQKTDPWTMGAEISGMLGIFRLYHTTCNSS